MINSTYNAKALGNDKNVDVARFLREMFEATPLYIFVTAIKAALR
jgi:hypothetical protein